MSQQRFTRRGITKIFWLEQIRAKDQTPSRAELSAPNATELTAAISDVEGWALTNEAIETPDMATTFTSSIPGEDKAEDSSLTFYEDKVSDAVEQLLPKGAKGWMVFLRKGDVPEVKPGSKSVEVFPVQVASRSPQYSTGNEAAKFQVSFTITDPPVQDVSVPPAALKTLPAPVDGEECEDEESVGVTVVAAATVTEHGGH